MSVHTRELLPAHSCHQNRSPHPHIQLQSIHPSGVPGSRPALNGAASTSLPQGLCSVKGKSDGLLLQGRMPRWRGVIWSIFAPALTEGETTPNPTHSSRSHRTGLGLSGAVPQSGIHHHNRTMGTNLPANSATEPRLCRGFLHRHGMNRFRVECFRRPR